MKLNDLAIHLLFAIRNEKSTGYDLTKAMSKSHVWRSSHQQTYRELNKLFNSGLVTVEVVPQDGKPDRKLYSMTPSGRDAIEAAKNTAPEVAALHSLNTVMINLGNKTYFERLAEQLTTTVVALKTQMIKTECPVERLAMGREIAIHSAELAYCADVIQHLVNNSHSKAA